MIDRLAFGLTGVVALLLLYASARAFRCNLRQYRAARTTAPLEGVDLSGARQVEATPPATWPAADEVTDARLALGYASLAADRAVARTYYGELLTIVGGAWVGAGLPLILRSYWAVWSLGAAIATTVAGVVMRGVATRRWEPVRDSYRNRYTALTAQPPPEPREAPERRGLFGRLRLGRR